MLQPGNPAAAKAQGPSLTGHLDFFDKQLSQAHDILADLRAIGDRLGGPIPRDTGRGEQSGAEAQKPAIVPAMASRHQGLNSIFNEMRDEIERVKGLL